MVIAGGGAQYQLTVENAGDVTIGGIVAGNRISSRSVIGTGFFNTKTRESNVGASDTIRLRQGDLGVVDARNESFYGGFGTIRVPFGSMRSLSGSGVGAQLGNTILDDVTLRIGHSIGRLQATGNAGGAFGGDVFVNFFDDGTDQVGLAIPTEATAGDDIQVVDAARDVYGNFVVGRGIGSIVAGGDWATTNFALPNSRIFVNIDDINDDGFVDMLSLGGNVGFSDPENDGAGTVVGGPAIDVGTNGNFRYFDIREEAVVIRDGFFGNSPGDSFLQVRRGESFDFTDDSGTRVRIEPDEGIANPNFDAVTDRPEDASIENGTLEVLTYPVRSGGSILVSLRTDRSVTVTNLDRGERTTSELGNLFLSGINGRPVTQQNVNDGFSNQLQFQLQDNNPNNLFDFDDGLEDVEVLLEGRSVDLFNVQPSGLDNGSPVGDGRVSRLVNNSSGEILSATLTSIGELRAPCVGIAQTRGQAELNIAAPRSFNAGAQTPFLLEPHLIAVEGSIVSIEADSVGNIYVGGEFGIDEVEGGTQSLTGLEPTGDAGDGIGNTNRAGFDAFGQPTMIQDVGGLNGIGIPRVGELRGVIGSIRADAFGGDLQEFNAFGRGRDLVESFEGIAGPIVAVSPETTDEIEGEIRFVDIGEGIADDGSGEVSRAGLYAEGFITRITGSNADIRGEISANEINEISLDNGSIIGADIFQPDLNTSGAFSFQRGIEFNGEITTLTEADDLPQDPFYELDSIRITNGGIIGTSIGFTDIDSIVIDDGFGIMRTDIGTVTEGVINQIVSNNNVGIRNVSIDAGQTLNTFAANGDASLGSLASLPITARLGDQGFDFDPFTGREISPANDVRRSLGLPQGVDSRRRVTNTGVIENVDISGTRDLGSYTASVTRSNLNSFLAATDFIEDASGIGGFDPNSPDFPNRVAFGRNIGTVDVISTFGFQSTSGEVDNVDAARDLINTLLRVSGRFETVDVGGAIFGDTFLRAEGPDGSIGSVTAGDVFGVIRAEREHRQHRHRR